MNSGIHVSLKAEVLGYFFGFPITNSLVMTWLVMVLLISFAYFFGKNLKMVPSKLQTVI
jgi:F0F1-type ATP synthase membrane subunit a